MEARLAALEAALAARRPVGRPRLSPEQIQAAKVRKTERQRERRHEASQARAAQELPCGCGSQCTFDRAATTARREQAARDETQAQAEFNAARNRLNRIQTVLRQCDEVLENHPQ